MASWQPKGSAMPTEAKKKRIVIVAIHTLCDAVARTVVRSAPDVHSIEIREIVRVVHDEILLLLSTEADATNKYAEVRAGMRRKTITDADVVAMVALECIAKLRRT